ncbi:Os08g0276000 [Oryza sativa Japonica Group]|jgi:transmembrane 9 superfamily protein 2/4|uniref:Transmembrane 9 superfamily member n=1 Tax=Oryza sativa subsp. japonica TaxID=39947 RepID=A0A0P0XDY8_ORYSJ|nr:Os08g0276000 [Oryza sativa Japonica Group]
MAISPVAAMALAIALAALCLAGLAAGFYLPGVAPNNFDKKDPLQVKVNKLTSIKTQLPYSYVDSAQNLGEVLRGDRIENSPYTFEMREPQMLSNSLQDFCRGERSKDSQGKD